MNYDIKNIQTNLIGEMWKSIKMDTMADNEIYEISNFGRIKSFKVDKENGIIINGSILKGYNILNIKLKNNKRTTKYVHKLVAECFIPKDSNSRRNDSRGRSPRGRTDSRRNDSQRGRRR